MNLGDGLKLETEVLDGKPRLILAASDVSKSAMKMGIKARAPKQALRIRHSGHILRSAQNACIKQENLKPRSESSLSMTKCEKLQVIKHSSHEATTKDHSLIIKRDGTSRYPDSENPNVFKIRTQKPQSTCVSAEDLRSLACLTQEQLQQILMAVKGTRSISETHHEKQEETVTNEASEDNTVLLQKPCAVSCVTDEPNSDSSRKQEAYLQPGQQVTKDSWKPADMFSTLGEREGEKALLEFRRTQWKKELDEQVALKKKLKETLEGEVDYFWSKPGNSKAHKDKVERANLDKRMLPADPVITSEESCDCATESNKVLLNISNVPAGQTSDFSSSDLTTSSCAAFVLGETVPQEHSALKHEQQKKWLEELDRQKEEAKLRKLEEKLELSKVFCNTLNPSAYCTTDLHKNKVDFPTTLICFYVTEYSKGTKLREQEEIWSLLIWTMIFLLLLK